MSDPLIQQLRELEQKLAAQDQQFSLVRQSLLDLPAATGIDLCREWRDVYEEATEVRPSRIVHAPLGAMRA